MDLTKDLVIDEGYIDWQMNRMNFIIKMFGTDFFKGKKILELGSYLGGNTQMFHNLGANIQGVEGNIKNLNTLRENYPHLNVIQGDCDNPVWEFDDHYDIIVHWGLLYHLKDVKTAINIAMEHTDLMFLETVVLDVQDNTFQWVKEDIAKNPDHALNGIGTVPSVSCVESILSAWKYERFDDPALNSQNQPRYDAPVGDTGLLFRKFWIVRK